MATASAYFFWTTL